MKTTFATLIFLLLGSIAQAKIANSTYDVKHQDMLENAIFNACNMASGSITQISSDKTEDHFDQGAVASHFTTKLKMVIGIDPGMYDTYQITAQSSVYSGFGHTVDDQNVYVVESVTCEFQQ